jgi:phenylalanyl-tRNA synthetase beta chain
VSITLRHARLESLLGMHVDREESIGILCRLGCSVSARNAESTVFLAPTHRPDLGREVDLIEEVARARGLDEIPTVLPAIQPRPPRTTGVLERRVRHVARELGLSEAVSYGFGSARELELARRHR